MIKYIVDNLMYIIIILVILVLIRKFYIENFTHLPEWSNDLQFYKLKQIIPECPKWDYACRVKNGNIDRDLIM